MQSIPPDDTFDYGNSGSDPYGTFLLGYLGWKPRSGMDAGVLAQSVGASGVGPGRAYAIGEESIATNDHIPVAFMRRQGFDANISVRGVFKYIARTGAVSQDDGYEIGVFARASGGSLTDDGTEFVHYLDGDGYGALLTRTGSSAYDMKIVRWSGGTETTLATTPLVLYPPTLSKKALKLRLDVYTDTSGDVSLEVFAQNLKALDLTPQRPRRGGAFVATASSVNLLDIQDTWVSVVSHTDSSGSKITAAGRCGFVTEREREYDAGARRVVTAVSFFGVRKIDTEPVFLDGFRRAALNLCRQFTDAWGDTARSVQSDFTHDLFSAEQVTSTMLRRDTAAEGITQIPIANAGNAVNLVPGTSDYIKLNLSDASYVSKIPLRTQTLFSWTMRANVDVNAAGNIFFGDFLNLGNGTSIGMTLGLKVGVGANTFRMFATVSSTSSGSGTTYETADISEVGMLGTDNHFAWTVSSVDNRVRFYREGSLVVERAMTENPEIRGANDTRVGWNGTPGGAAANFLDGQVDDLRLYWTELTADQVTHLAADPSGVGGSLDPANLLARWDLEALTGSPALGSWFPDRYGASPALTATFEGSAALTTGLSAEPRTRAYSASQRKVDSSTNQNRAVTVEVADQNTTAGVFVRGGLTAAGVFSGYRVDLFPSPSGEVRLWRVNSDTEELLATASATLTVGTQYEVGLQVSQATIADPNAAAILAVYLDGTQVVLASSAFAGGVTADAAGTVRDASAARILSGGLEGFHILNPGGTAATDVDLWTQGPLSSVIFGATGPSITIRSEISGVTGSLNDQFNEGPLRPLQRSQASLADGGMYESDHDWRYLRSISSRRLFRLRYLVSAAELSGFRTFFDEHLAGEIPFSFTPPGEDAGVFTLASPRFSAEPQEPDTWLLAFDVVELVDPSTNPSALSPPSAYNPLLWFSAQANVFDVPAGQGLVETANVKERAVLSGDVERLHDARLVLPQVPSAGFFGRMLNNAFIAAPNPPPYALTEFASAAVLNGKRTLESRADDEMYVGFQNILFFTQKWWTDQTGFTFMAHIIPPTSGYGASEYILRLEGAGAAEMMRIGWTTSQFYRIAGNVFGGFGITGYDFGSSAVAKTIVCRWIPGSQVRLWDSGGTEVGATTGFGGGTGMTSATPVGNQVFVAGSTESTSVQADAGIGTKLFVQEMAVWDRALTDAELNAVGNYWAAQYGSTWTEIT